MTGFSTGLLIAHVMLICKIRCCLIVDNSLILQILFISDQHRNYSFSRILVKPIQPFGKRIERLLTRHIEDQERPNRISIKIVPNGLKTLLSCSIHNVDPHKSPCSDQLFLSEFESKSWADVIIPLVFGVSQQHWGFPGGRISCECEMEIEGKWVPTMTILTISSWRHS